MSDSSALRLSSMACLCQQLLDQLHRAALLVYAKTPALAADSSSAVTAG